MRAFLIVLSALLLLAGSAAAETGLRANNNDIQLIENDGEEEIPQRRELTSWFSFLFSLHCAPGPLGNKCRSGSSGGSGGSSSGGSSSGGSSSGGSSSGGSSSSSSSGGGSSSYSGEGDAVSSYDYVSGGESEEQTGTSSHGATPPLASRAARWWLLAVAGAAAVAAMAAAVVGSRKKKRKPHQLEGSVARRMQLFSNFADSALCASADRPDRVVEMSASHDDYRLA